MFNNYVFLKRSVIELNSFLSGYEFVSAFSQEKDKLVVEFATQQDKKYLEFTVNQNSPSIQLRNDFHRAKKNSISFFKNLARRKVSAVKIANNDRIILFDLEGASLAFYIRGRLTNIIKKIDDSDIENFKSLNLIDNHFIDSIFSAEFSDSPTFKLDIPQTLPANENIKNQFPFLNKDILSEYKLRNPTGKFDIHILQSCIDDILTKTIRVSIYTGSKEVSFSLSSFHSVEVDESDDFTSYYEALNFYFKRKYQLESFSKLYKVINDYLKSELNYLSDKINDLSARVNRGSKHEEYQKIANLIILSFDKISRGNLEYNTEDIFNNGELITIKLKEKLNPQENANHYFEKARSEKLNYLKSKELLKSAITKYGELIQKKELFLQYQTVDELRQLLKGLKIKADNTNNPTIEQAQQFKHYIIDEKYDFYVGKDSKNNDLLTMKFAKPNDYWFHARSVPGSHCLLRVTNTKETIPKSVLKKAASIAAYHSKAKTAGVVPVSYTFKKYVTKKKGMEIGQVILLKEDVLLVTPQIPNGVEFLSTEN
ncbi:MAG TPA: NFACT RNA binding domain-containing protein [Ignavibacteriaceae bacterium]|nr:NFACT RNA binding domain-containing protein [Ignavibacteriaceae bacterium]